MNQKQRNRRIAEQAVMASHNIDIENNGLSALTTAHVALNTYLCQDDIDLLSKQISSAEDECIKRSILLAWYDWLEAERKFEKAYDSHTGCMGGVVIVWAMRAKADMAREKAQQIL